MANIRITELPIEEAPSALDEVPIDGNTTRKTTVEQLVAAGWLGTRASISEAQAGIIDDKSLTPQTGAELVKAVGPTLFAPIGEAAAAAASADSAFASKDQAVAAASTATTAAETANSAAGTATGAASSAQTNAGVAMSARNAAETFAVDAATARDQSQMARIGSETARDIAAGYASDANASEQAAASSASSAAAIKAQAELAAMAAGAPLFTSEPALPGAPSPYLLSVDAGVQVYTHNGSTRTFIGWLGKVEFDSPAQMLAYPLPLGPVGTIVGAGGFRYRIAASVVTDEHLVTAGGVKLYALPGTDGFYNFDCMAPAKDGVTDDYPKFKKLLDTPGKNYPVYNASGFYQSGANVFFEPSTYFMGETINLKKAHHLKSTGSGLNENSGAILKFPADKDGIIINRINTMGRAKEAVQTGGADGSIIEGLTVVGGYEHGSGFFSRGITMRARALVTRCAALQFGGNGLHVVAAASGTTDANIGNANLFQVDIFRASKNGGYGVFIDLADTNAGRCTALNVTDNGDGGVFDSSFLGNYHGYHHSAGNGTGNAGYNAIRGRTATVWYSGRFYTAVPAATEAQLAATAPGTNPNIWIDRGITGPAASTTSPEWLPGQPVGTYFPGTSYKADGLNAAIPWIGCYTEAGDTWSYFQGNSVPIGQSIGQIWGGGTFNMKNGIGLALGFTGSTPNGTGTTNASIGGVSGQVLSFDDSGVAGASNHVWRLTRQSDGSYRMTVQNQGIVFELTDTNDAANPRMLRMPSMALGVGTSARKFGRWSSNTKPTTGTFNKGDMFLYLSPNAGGKMGFVCTTGGDLTAGGVVKEWGVIDA